MQAALIEEPGFRRHLPAKAEQIRESGCYVDIRHYTDQSVFPGNRVSIRRARLLNWLPVSGPIPGDSL